MENKTVEITVRQSSKVVLIAKFLKDIPGGTLFIDEVKNETFALRFEDIVKLEVL